MVELLAVNPKKGDDKFYRYKMQRIQVKVEGKGNGIKTVVVNLSSVAQSLARPGSHVIKWFGQDLGAQTNIDPPDDRWIINGSHDAEVLQKSLFTFIEKFVLCDDCGNPETDISIKDDVIRKDCKACGARSRPLPPSNLTNFILKTQSKKGKKEKKTKAERQAARRAKQLGLQNGNGSGGDDDSENGSNENGSNENGEKEEENDEGSDDEFAKIQAQAIEAPKIVNEDDWAVDMSEEAVKARQNNLPSEFRQKLVLEGGEEDEDAEGGGNTAYDELGNWVLETAKAKGVDTIDDLEVYKKAKELGIEAKYKTVMVLAQTLFDERIVAQIPKRKGLFKAVSFPPATPLLPSYRANNLQLVKDPEDASKISERHEKALLGGIERLLATKGKEKEHAKLLTPDVISNGILYRLYDSELISEDFVRKWGKKASKKYCDLSTSREIRRGAEPFLKWLDEADEESSEEE